MHNEITIYFPLSVLSFALSVMFFGCGDGGGGSQNPGNDAPISTQPQPNVLSSAFNPSDPSHAAAAHARGMTGARVNACIFDSDFDVADPELF
ncbi:MAG: hypothetical protein H7240_12955, partial [Glaciimonas sp.]|nr:hypothetical protein [Glaciimonas sp.]